MCIRDRWMIDPDGYRHLQKVVVGVRLGTSERNKQAMLDKFGTEDVYKRQPYNWDILSPPDY